MSRVAKAGAPTVSVGGMLRLANDRDYYNAAVRNDRPPEVRMSGEKGAAPPIAPLPTFQ